MSNVSMDIIGLGGAGQGSVAKLLTQNMDTGVLRPFIDDDGKCYITTYSGHGDREAEDSYQNQLVTNATLRRDEWIQLDEALIPVARERLVAIQDLIDRNLVYNLGNGMGTTVLETQDISNAMEAVMTMDGVTRGKNDRPEFGSHYLPIPIIHSDYEINARVLSTSRNLGNPLDTTSAALAGYVVAEYLEGLLFTSTANMYKFGNGIIYSYINYPHRNLVTLDSKWSNSGVTGKQIVKDISAMKAASIAAKHYGPFVLYIPTAYETLIDEDYNDYRGGTIRARILEINNISSIKIADKLPADNVLLVQMTTDTVRLVRGIGLQNVSWGEEGNFVTKYKVLTIQVPQMRSDQAGNSGITHATFTA